MAEQNGAKKVKDMKTRLHKRDGELSDYVFGKVQPQATDLEAAVLGALMLDKDALPVILDILQPESFYLELHQLIYRAILRLFDKSHPVDLLTVTEELKKSGDIDTVGGAYYLVELTGRVGSSANIEYHSRIVAQKHIQRELIKVSTKIIKDAYEDTTDVFTLLDDAEQGLFAVTQNNLSRQYESMGELASKTMKILEELKDREDGLTGVPTGFTDLDRLTSGWQPSDLIIVAARPGMGKTSFVLSLARNAALDFNKGVAVFSLEMASTQLVQRLISMEAEISGSKLRSGKLEEYEWQQLQTVIERMSEVPIYIDDTPGINIFELRAKCRRLKMQKDIQLVIIDYLQLMSGGGNNKNANREQEISQISRALKGLAKELSVPVIALSQLSRAVEVRGGSKRPQLSDLRECLTGDTRISLKDGSWVPLRELVGKEADVISANILTQQLRNRFAELVWETGKRPVYELRLTSGKKIRATAQHRFLGRRGWQEVQSLKPGERLAVARILPEPESPAYIPEDRLMLLSHFIASGCYRKGRPLSCSASSEALRDLIANAAVREFGVRVLKPARKDERYQLVFTSDGKHRNFQHIIGWITELGIFDQRPEEKRIPGVVFRLGNREIALFLQHLWSARGEITYSHASGSLTSNIAFRCESRYLAEGVAHLLLRFGIAAHIEDKQDGLFHTTIKGFSNQLQFLEQVGVLGDKRNVAAKLRFFLRKINADAENPDGPAKRAHHKELALQVQPRTDHPAREENGILLAGQGPQKDVRTTGPGYASEFRWEVIEAIDHAGEETVYDMTVPDHHSFVANGIISHNSGAIEQDADIVSFIYRPEYYQILEDESGQSLKGVAEVIIAKHRNGALDTVKLRFTDQFARFSDLGDPNFDDFPASDPFATPFEPSNVITRPSKMNDDEDIPF